MDKESFHFAMSVGGDFMYHLCHAFMFADSENLAKLKEAFPEIAKKYVEMKNGV